MNYQEKVGKWKLVHQEKMDKEWEEKQAKFINDINVCKMLLDNLQEDYKSPVPCRSFNKSKITRTRLMIHDILKKY